MTRQELIERQGWSLEQKIDHALGVIEHFYNKLNGQVYISFSGGKDSTVLYWLARKIYPDIKAVFCNTGNEYPDIVKFVREMKDSGLNIDIIQRKLKPKEVLAKYGFPLVSKETSQLVRAIRYNPNSKRSQRAMNLPKTQLYAMPRKWEFLINERFDTSNMCCDKLKKEPFFYYSRDNGLAPILGTLADESRLRTSTYIRRGGCNVFNEETLYKSSSLPLSIWTEKDIWDCIKKYNIPIADIYNKGVERTGCMFCGFGIQYAHDNRLQIAYENYPKFYHLFMNYQNHGVTYRDAARKVCSARGLHLPDEKPQTLFD